MTGYTPNLSIPYPNDYAQPADVPAALQALALRVDAIALSRDRIASGSVSVSVDGSQNGTAAVSFGPFPGNPRVVATAQNVVYNCSVTGLTASGCNINVRHVDGTAQTANVPVHWIAIYGEG